MVRVSPQAAIEVEAAFLDRIIPLAQRGVESVSGAGGPALTISPSPTATSRQTVRRTRRSLPRSGCGICQGARTVGLGKPYPEFRFNLCEEPKTRGDRSRYKYLPDARSEEALCAFHEAATRACCTSAGERLAPQGMSWAARSGALRGETEQRFCVVCALHLSRSTGFTAPLSRSGRRSIAHPVGGIGTRRLKAEGQRRTSF